jgi:hypothetical protein
MRKLLALLFLLGASAVPVLAQYTTVSSTGITDAAGVLYINGTYSIQLTNPTGQPAYFLGSVLPRDYQAAVGILSSTATFSVSIPSNAYILAGNGGPPSKMQYSFTICSSGNSGCFTGNITVSGSSQDVTSTLNAASPHITFPLPPGWPAAPSGDCPQANGTNMQWAASCGSSSGVTSFSAQAALSPLFTTSVATPTTTPALTFALSNAPQNSVFAGPATGGAGPPSFQTAPTISAANMTNFPTFNQNTTGNAGTATALAATPTQCTSPLFATGITASGNANCVGSQTANFFYAAPNGSAGTPIFRAIVAADVPTLNQNTTGTAANLAGCTPSAAGDICYYNGSAWTRLAGNASGTNVLQETSAGVPSWAAPSGAVSSVSNSDGTLTISPTTGAVVASLALGHANTWSGQQTFVAPILGTPASGLATNLTGLPLTTGVTGILPVANGGTGLATQTSNVIYKGNGTGVEQVSSITDNGTTAASTDTGGYVAPVFVANGGTAGFVDYPQGTTSAAVAPCNTATSWCVQAATAMTAGVETLDGTRGQGVTFGLGSSSAIQDGNSGDANHSTTVTISSATSVSSTSLCSTTNCPAGTYQVNGYLDVTTACTTTGGYFVSIIYTDDAGSKTVVMPLIGTGVTASLLTSTGISSSLALSSTSNFAQGDLFIRSTGAASINYSTTASACATGGPAAGKLYLSLEPVQ